jgi:hypothetical protein
VLFNRSPYHETISFGVVNGNKFDPNLTILGPISSNDLSLHFQRVVISSDKTVIATESIIKIKETSFWLAYDFLNLTPYGYMQNPFEEDPNSIKIQENTIKQLINSRGGIGQELLDSNFDVYEKGNKLSWLAWKKWQSIVDKAKKNRS